MPSTSNAENIRLGTCKIIYDGQDVGLTIGGVEVTVSTTTHETKVDQFGESIVEERITGRNVMVKVPMAETTLDNMARIMPGAELITDATAPDKKKVVVNTGTGLSLIQRAKLLRLHPVDLPDTDKSEDFVIPLAATPGGVNFAYKTSQERVYNADFKGYPDSAGVLFIYGDETATAAP